MTTKNNSNDSVDYSENPKGKLVIPFSKDELPDDHVFDTPDSTEIPNRPERRSKK
ncbi:hypothetical protein AADU86_002542 [Salmonella enterica]